MNDNDKINDSISSDNTRTEVRIFVLR